MYTARDHTFMICAYGNSPDLENCILSVLNQNILGTVLMSTSTPNEYITGLAKKYDLPLVVNSGKGDQVDNLNFAFLQAQTKLVTLCHQDVYYCPEYLEKILTCANKGNQPIIIFTDYFEIRSGKRVDTGKLLKIKQILNFPLRFSALWGSKWVRRRILSLGDPICNPSVTFNKSVLINPPFVDGYQAAPDWDAWERLSLLSGEYIYCPDKLVGNGINENSGTTETIANGIRRKEDYEMFCRFWPPVIAKVLLKIYSTAESSNTIVK